MAPIDNIFFKEKKNEIFFALALVLAGCDLSDSGDETGDGAVETTLKINNETFVYLYYVRWQGIDFNATGNWRPFIESGSTQKREVRSGSGYIFLKVGDSNCRTKDIVVVGDKENIEFTFHDNTVVVDVSSNTEKVLKDLY